MNIAIPVTADGQVEPRWGRAPMVAVATVESGQVTDWVVHQVGWDVAHDQGTEGSHHARIVRFLRENAVEAVVVDHMGQGMLHTLGKMGIPVLPARAADAREAVALIAPRD
ncbi:NifB/NifX family molybdenum-iron cluster-binding protein [Raineyella sp. LH-20]|uniref:NifB/NifX family molybdenum-iron cluster-binding protein n=1 Tax=Raineyella sp. LH-20 TaxID=3081204 RepID=UPI002955DC7A|nr:NifB/NifX family molybdenum-iron cluster-binding protein [Raineyella sp. LH-20]WOP19981.1 NifB/NifX family molybdenum-iron cluster-binding protein [Raineyella sp. LH-20]